MTYCGGDEDSKEDDTCEGCSGCGNRQIEDKKKHHLK